MQNAYFNFKTDNPHVEKIKEGIIKKIKNYFDGEADILKEYDCFVDEIEIDSAYEDGWHQISMIDIFMDKPQKILELLSNKSFTQFYLELDPSVSDPVYFTLIDGEFTYGDSPEEIGIIE